ncbi:hypothetical protein J2W51_003345 [Tardiphaga robiniae]|nr:hypothetical protein [Tardiphaga robiniae]
MNELRLRRGLPVIYSEHLAGDGQEMFQHPAKLNFEGIVSPAQPTRGGRRPRFQELLRSRKQSAPSGFEFRPSCRSPLPTWCLTIHNHREPIGGFVIRPRRRPKDGLPADRRCERGRNEAGEGRLHAFRHSSLAIGHLQLAGETREGEGAATGLRISDTHRTPRSASSAICRRIRARSGSFSIMARRRYRTARTSLMPVSD